MNREVVVAGVLVAGSEKRAAHRLDLSHSTVRHHLATARSKVGAETTPQLAWILAPRCRNPRARPKRTIAASSNGVTPLAATSPTSR
jgi:hypothetical protein